MVETFVSSIEHEMHFPNPGLGPARHERADEVVPEVLRSSKGRIIAALIAGGQWIRN